MGTASDLVAVLPISATGKLEARRFPTGFPLRRINGDKSLALSESDQRRTPED